MKKEFYIISENGQIIRLRIKAIIRCEARRSYTIFYVTNGKSYVESINIGEVVKRLHCYDFFYQTDKSHLISMEHFDYFDKANCCAIMNNGNHVPVSRRRKQVFLRMLKEKELPLVGKTLPLVIETIPMVS